MATSGLTTTLNLTPQILASACEELLAVKVPNFIHQLPAELYEMPRNGGTTLRRRRYNRPPPTLTPLGPSGQQPPPLILSALNLDATMSFYGSYYYINEQVILQSQEDVLTEASYLLGLNLRESEDILMRDMMAASASFVNCQGGSNGDNPTQVTYNDIGLAYRTLVGNDAMTISSMIGGENKFGTGPVRNAFLALCHTDLTNDLQQLPSFLNVANYPNQNGILPVEFGSIQNFRFMVSSIGSILFNASALAQNVYNIFCCAMESVCSIEQDMFSTQFIYRPAIFDGALAQNVSLAMKFAQVNAINNDQWILAVRATLGS